MSYSNPAGVGNGVGVSPGRGVGSRSIFEPCIWKNLATAVRLTGTPSTTATTTAAAAAIARTSGRRISGPTRLTAGAETADTTRAGSCGVTGADAFGAVAIEYLLYTLVSSWMAAVALSVLLVRGVLPQAMRTPIVAVIAGLIAFTLGCIVAAVLEVGLIERIVRALGQVIGRERTERVSVRIAPVEKVLVGFMHAQPGGLFQVLTIEAAGHALLAMEIWIVIQALALPARPSDPFVVEGGVKFISAAFFFIPGQIGASESVYAFLFNLLGLTAAAGLTMALVRRVRALIIAGAGLGVLALFKS